MSFLKAKIKDKNVVYLLKNSPELATFPKI